MLVAKRADPKYEITKKWCKCFLVVDNVKSDDSGCKIAVYKYKIKRFLEADVQYVFLKETK